MISQAVGGAKCSVVVAIAAGVLLIALPAAAAPRTDWDRSANIKQAAEHLIGLQQKGGAAAAYKFISACYKTHMLAERYGKALEACIAQDYMLTQTLVAIYERLTPEARRQIRAVEPLVLARAMSSRVSSVLTQYKMSEQDGLEIKKLVDKEGLPLFLAKSFPRAEDGAAGAPDGQPASPE